MLSTIDLELAELESVNLISFIPSFLLNYFKDDFNERLVQTLVNDLDHLIESIYANNSLKVLSLNDEQLITDESLNQSASSNTTDNFNLSSATKSIGTEISARMLEIFSKYEQEICAHLARFDRLNKKYSTKPCVVFTDRQEIFVYQRAILMEKLTNKHFDLLNLVFKSVFDMYHKLNQNEDEEETIEDSNNTDFNKPLLLENFSKFNHIL